MKPKNSPLVLSDIYIVASSLIAVPPTDGFNGDINLVPIDVDFNILQQIEDKFRFKIVVSIDGNDPQNPAPGYCFNIVAEGIFYFDNPDDLKPEERDSLLSHSAVPLVIGHIRSHLASISAIGPYDRYILPLFDFNDLAQQKAEEAKNSK